MVHERRSLPHVTMLLALALAAAAGSLGAQDLGEQLLAAAASDERTRAFEQLHLERRSLAEIFDAVAPRLARLGPLEGHLRGVLLGRASEAEELWRDEPGMRNARAPLFAWLPLPWVKKYATPAAGERRDLEVVARFLDPDSLLPQLREGATDDGRCAAVLRRIAVRAARELPHPVTAKLLEPHCFAHDIANALAGCETRARAFAALPLLTDDDPRVRARGAIAVRRRLAAHAPIQVRKLIAADQNPTVRESAANLSPNTRDRAFTALTDATAPKFVDAIAHDVGPGPIRGDALSAPVRATLFDALVEAGRRAGDEVTRRDRAGRFERSSRWYAAAAGIGAEEVRRLLQHAVETKDGEIRVQLLATLHERRIELDESCAGALQQLLDDPDPGTGELAALLIGDLLGRHRVAELRTRVFERASAVAGNLNALQSGRNPFWISGRPFFQPRGRDTQLFFLAARLGHAALLEPVIADLEAAGRPPPQPAFESRHWLELMCLQYLAVHATAEQARRLHTLLSPRYGKPLTSEGDFRVSVIAAALHALYATAPDDLVSEWYAPLLRDHGACQEICRLLANDVDAVPEGRLRAFLDATRDRSLNCHAELLVRFPEWLTADWLGGDEKRRGTAMGRCSKLVRTDPTRVRALVEQGALPRDLIAAACARQSLPLPLSFLAAVVPHEVGSDGAWTTRFAAAIDSATTTATPADFAALARLSANPIADVALAAAKRATRHGGDGEKLVRAVVTRLLDDANDEVVARALQLAVEAGIDTTNRSAAVLRLRTTTAGTMVADAADLRFAGLDPLRCAEATFWQSIELARVDVDADTLRARAGGEADPCLRRLLANCSPVTGANALRVTAELEVWSEELERSVLEQTLADQPAVRRAAYEALATRDPELWPCALLVHEAALDPDPSVQAVAARTSANGRPR